VPSKQLNPTLQFNWQFEAIGTHWSIETENKLNAVVQSIISDRIELFDATYSRFRDDSIVTAMASRAGVYEFPDDAAELMDFYRTLYDVTNGAVTPLIGSALVQSGYDKDYSFKLHNIQDIPYWNEVMMWKDSRVTTKQPLVLDIGAAGKGYLVDIIGELLEEHQIFRYVIDASGDIRHRGSDSQAVGLENPHDTSRVIGVMNLQNVSLCASASNRRKWGEKLHHIINPHTKLPVRDVVASWVIAKNTLVADGLATALFFVDSERLSQWDFQYVCLMADGKVTHSHEFMGELFI
jgi:FAD:protein FMN transferase